MKKTLLLSTLLLANIFALELSDLRKATPADLQTTCKKLENSMFPIRCASQFEDQAKPGKLFQQRENVTKEQLQPVLLLPGFGGSGLEAQLESARPISWWCYKNSSWYRVWLAFLEFFVGSCWTQNMKLEYFPMNDTYMNTLGVDVRPIDFGGVKGIDFLDYILDYPLSFTSVYGSMIRSLMSIGYEPGKNLRGVTYDWRYPPNKEPQLMEKVKILIEETYANNNNQSVHVVTHSMGGPTFLYFLNQMPYAWKQKYIASFIPIAAPWSGSPKALRALISGDDFGINVMGYSIPNKLNFRELARTLGGLVFLVPDSHYWKDEILVSTSTVDYKTTDIAQLFTDLNATTTGEIYENVDGMMYQLSEPEVKVHCLYGINMPTEIKYYYTTDNFDRDPTHIDYSESGDGTVPLRSLELCGQWKKYQTEPVVTKEFDLLDHFKIIEDPDIIDYVLKVVTGKL